MNTVSSGVVDDADSVDAVVIGAGVVGLAIARELALAGREVIILEKEGAFGQGVSSRNSEVIHAGLQYPSGSLKAQLCVRGKALLYDYCQERGVAFSNCGKLVVATNENQHDTLRAMQSRATANGVATQWLSAAAARELEPALACTAAVHSPTTGIVDSHALMTALLGDCEGAGGALALRSELIGARFGGGGALLQVRSPEGMSLLRAKLVVNAASLSACALARRFEGLDPGLIPREHFAKGSYFSLVGKTPFSRLIYPVPQDAWLGVHFTLDLGGQGKFGPDLEWLKLEDAAEIDYAVDPARAQHFYAAVRSYWPALPDAALQASYSGVRPKIYGAHQTAPDFLIQTQAEHGVPGLINLFGIESPGLTASMAIGEFLAQARCAAR